MTRRKYSIGDKVRMSSDALDNYGKEYADSVFTIQQWYGHYCPSNKISPHDPHGHPGYDEATGDSLYHLSGLNFDLYDWELVRA